MKPVHSYIENGVTINVYPEHNAKHPKWMKNDTFFASKQRTDLATGHMFTPITRKAGKA